eukprot:4904226-Pleurochrysis_carterae.AAC.1
MTHFFQLTAAVLNTAQSPVGRGRGSKTHHGVIQCLKALKDIIHKDAGAVERSDKEAFYKAASRAMKQSAAQAARNWLST